MTRAEQELPKRVEIPCWRCGRDTSAGFDTVNVRGPRVEEISGPVIDYLMDWLDEAANEADEIGPNHRAERVAAAVLGRPDPWPAAKPPHRPIPEAVVTHVEGVPQ